MFIRHGGSTGDAAMGEASHEPSGVGERCKVKEWVTREPERPDTVHVKDGRSGVQPALHPKPRPDDLPAGHRERASDDTNKAGTHGTDRRKQ